MRSSVCGALLAAAALLIALACIGSDQAAPLLLEGDEELLLEGEDLRCVGEIILRDSARLVVRDGALILSRREPMEDWASLSLHDNATVELEDVTIEGDAEGLWISAFDSAELTIRGVTERFSAEGNDNSRVVVESCHPSELRVRDRATVIAEDVRVGWTIDLGLWDQPTFSLDGLVREMEIDDLSFGPENGFPWRLELHSVRVNGWSVHVGRDTDVHIANSVLERIVLILDGASGELVGLQPKLYEHWTFPDDAGLTAEMRLVLENTEMADHWAVDIYRNADLDIRDCAAMWLDFRSGHIDARITNTELLGLVFHDVMGDVVFENVSVRDELSVEDTVWLTMTGSVAFASEAVVRDWENSMVQRTFMVELTRMDGSPAVGQQASVVMPDGSTRTLTADSSGRMELSVIFDDDNHNAVIPVSIDPGDRPIERTIDFLTDTPLDIDFLRASVDPTTLYVGTPDALGSFYPPDSQLRGHVYEALFVLDSNSRPVPLLAASVPTIQNGGITIRDDGTSRVTILVRSSVAFHSGDPLRLEDVESSIEQGLIDSARQLMPDALEAATGATDLDALIEAVGIDAAAQQVLDAVFIEDGAVVVELRRPYSGLWAFLAGSPIVQRDWMDERGGWDGTPSGLETYRSLDPEHAYEGTEANGTGPFLLADVTDDSRGVTLLRNLAYWGEPAAFGRVVVYCERSPGELIELLASETIDVVADMPNELLQDDRLVEAALEDVQTLKPYSVLDRPGIMWALFNQLVVPGERFDLLQSGEFNEASAPVDLFTDVDVRLGFLHGFDWPTFLVEAAGTGRTYRPINTPLAPFLFEALRGGVTYEYDPGLALEHFGRAWGGRLRESGFTVDACFNGGNDARRQFSQALGAAMSALEPSLHVGIYDPDFNTIVDGLFADELPLIVLGLTEGIDILDHPFMLLHSEGLCPCGASVPAFDGLLERAAWTLDLDERDAILRELHGLVADDPIGLFWRGRVLHVEQQWVRGLEHDPFYRFGQIPGFDLRGVWKDVPD